MLTRFLPGEPGWVHVEFKSSSWWLALIGVDRGVGSRFGQSRGTAPEDAALEEGRKREKEKKQAKDLGKSVLKYSEISSWLCLGRQELFCRGSQSGKSRRVNYGKR